MNVIISIDDYINKLINKTVINDKKLLHLINICKHNGYELMETTFHYRNLFVFCRQHGIFITTSDKIRNNRRCSKCYSEHTINIHRNNNNSKLFGMIPIPGFENYFISKDAKIYSIISEDFIVINVEKCKKNNRTVRIKVYNNQNKRKSMELSRLVALTYLPNPENKKEVNHIDGNKYNNHLTNLEWNTIKENRDHAVKNKLVKPCDQNKPIDKYDLNGNFIKSYSSIKEAMIENKISNESIRDCLSGKTKNPRYFIWKEPIKIENKNEIWKDVIICDVITGFKVSNFGRIKNEKSIRKGKILKGTKCQGNYIIIDISYNNGIEIIRKSKRLHHLVAIAFIPNPENKPEVDHIDTNVSNNNVTNLRWSTRKENMNNEITKKKFEKPVEQLDDNGKVINTFKSVEVANKYITETYGISRSISGVCNNKKGYRKAAGYKWRFKKIE